MLWICLSKNKTKNAFFLIKSKNIHDNPLLFCIFAVDKFWITL